MGFLITGSSVKYFAKALHCLCRLGNEIYLESKGAKLHIKTWNASRSTFASFSFEQSFFEAIEAFTLDENDESLTCKISSKTFLQVFRSVNFIERSVETCEAKLSDNGDQLIFTLNCKHAVVKTYQMNYEECEAVQAIYAKDLSPNKLTAPTKLFLEVISNFPTSVDEITLSVTPCKVVISSYTDKEDIGKVMSTEMTLDPKEFSYFQIGVDACISFSLRDLRAILLFAESSNTECKMSFEYEGKPFVIELAIDNISAANFVLATIAGNNDTQVMRSSTISECSIRKTNETVTAKSKRTGQKDMQNGRNVVKETEMLPNNNNGELPRQTLVSDILFAAAQPSQGLRKTILAADSDEES